MTTSYTIRVAPEEITNRNETLDAEWLATVPQHNCVKVYFDSDALELSQLFDASSCRVSERETWPSVYIGDEVEGLETTDAIQQWIDAINMDLLTNRDGLEGIGEYALEHWMNARYAPFGFWSTRFHPVEAMEAAIPPGKVGTKPKNKRVRKHQTADEVARAETSNCAKKHLDEKEAHHRLVSKPQQKRPAILSVDLENNTVKGMTNPDFDPNHPSNRLLSDKEIAARQHRKIDTVIDGAGKLKMLGTLTHIQAAEFGKWCLKTHNVPIRCLDNGDGFDLVFRPLKCEGAKSISTKFRFAAKKCVGCKPIAAKQTAKPESTIEITDEPDSKRGRQVSFKWDIGNGDVATYIVVDRGSKRLYKDSAHLGGPWSNAETIIGNDTVRSSFRNRIVSACNRLKSRRAEAEAEINELAEEECVTIVNRLSGKPNAGILGKADPVLKCEVIESPLSIPDASNSDWQSSIYPATETGDHLKTDDEMLSDMIVTESAADLFKPIQVAM